MTTTPDPSTFSDQIVAGARRRRDGFSSFCVSVDLLGMREMMRKNPAEAASRLNDLQGGMAESTLFYPGGSEYRGCFLGDSWFLVREVSPDECVDDLWPAFCGHVYALASTIKELEVGLGNPGIRAVAARGPLIQVFSHDGWRHADIGVDTARWFVLTGADMAFLKSETAQRIGKSGGFVGNLFWFEVPGRDSVFWGTPFAALSPDRCRQPELYPRFFEEMCRHHTHEAHLPESSPD